MGDERKMFGHAIFCDDIRYEVGGKFSLIGTYGGTLFVHTDFPVSLPKFGISIHYSEPVSTFGKAKVEIRVYMPGNEADHPSASTEIPFEEIIKGLDRATFEKPGLPPVKYGNATLQMVFSPLVITTEGVIKVRAYRGDDKVRLGALRVLRAESPKRS